MNVDSVRSVEFVEVIFIPSKEINNDRIVVCSGVTLVGSSSCSAVGNPKGYQQAVDVFPARTREAASGGGLEFGDHLLGAVGEDEGEGFLGEVASADQPLVVLLDQQRAGEPDRRGIVGEDPHDV